MKRIIQRWLGIDAGAIKAEAVKQVNEALRDRVESLAHTERALWESVEEVRDEAFIASVVERINKMQLRGRE